MKAPSANGIGKQARLVIGTSLLAIGNLLATAAAAQEAPPPAPGEGEILVSGQRGALNEAIRAERNAETLKNIVTADDVGQFGDQNSAEALQRLPGVTIERDEGEGRFVSIRGLPSSFTQVTVNGARIGTSDAGSSTVALDVIPSDLLGSIEVTKTYTADMDGDTIGGAVELKSLSAYDNKDDITAVRIEGSVGEYAKSLGPKASFSFARKFFDDTLGVALTGSYFKRFIEGDDLRNEDGFQRLERGGEIFLYPREVNQRFEVGVRERIGGTINIEYRPSDDHEFYLRSQITRLNDDDIRIQSQWQIERATGSEIQEIADGGGRFIDVRQRNQTFFQPTADRQSVFTGGHRNTFGDVTWSSQVDFSRSRWTQRDGVRGRFQIDDIGTNVTYGRDSAFIEAFRDRTRPDPANLAAYRFQSLLFIEEERIDEIFTIRTDLRWDVSSDMSFQTGVKLRQRDKSADKIEYNGDPAIGGINVTLDQVAPLLEQPRFQTFGPFPSLSAARALYLDARDQLLDVPRFFRADQSAASDFSLSEDVLAAYALGRFQLTPNFQVIAGVRMENTKFESTGFFLEADGEGNTLEETPVIPIFLGTARREYTDFLPSLVLRWDATPTLLVRASYGRGIARPDFEDASNRQRIGFDATNEPEPGEPGFGDPNRTTRDLVAGNPNLVALMSDNFDVSVAWYPNQTTVLQAAVFHKEISNFFLDLTSATRPGEPAVLPPGIELPDGISSVFRRIETTINGGKARVTGVELSYSQTFPNAPGILSGLFLTGNLTLARSRAETLERPGENLPFPDQADITGNFSLGYEDKRFSLRGSVNHRGETLAGISTEEFAGVQGFPEDRFRAAYTQYDINLRLNVAEGVQLYADAINITGEKDIRFYRGNDFPLYERVQDFGATYQIGARVTF